MSKSTLRAALAAALTLSLAGIIGCGGGYRGSNGGWNNGGWNNGGWNNGGWNGNNNGTRTITCESEKGRQQTCSAGMYIGRAEVAQRLSDTPCQLGRTWGYSGNNIWVNQGCRAQFRVYAQGGGGYNPNNGGWNGGGNNNGNSTLVICESQDGSRRRCNVGFPIQKAEIAERYSDVRCQKGQTWGVNGQNLWVDQGCRAKFRVYR